MDTNLKKHLYNKDDKAGHVANLAVGTAIGSIAKNRTDIKRYIDNLACRYLINPSVVEATAVKYYTYLNTPKKGATYVYSSENLFDYPNYYSKDDLKTIDDYIKEFRECYAATRDVCDGVI